MTAPQAVWTTARFQDCGAAHKVRLRVALPVTLAERLRLCALLDAFTAADAATRAGDYAPQLERAARLVCAHTLDWSGVADADDRPLPFSRERLGAALASEPFLLAATGAVVSAVRGRQQPARRHGR